MKILDIWRYKVWEQLKTIGLNDIIDIVLLSLMLYYVYKFIRDRRAGKLLIGLGVLVSILVLSYVFRLKAITFIFENFFQVGLTAVIILFQPELRAALEKMGNTPLSITGIKRLGGDSGEQANVTEVLDSVCDAVFEMARSKTGALIVFERSTKLGDFIKSGVYIDAAISPYIIRNIFFNKAPLHDGAVIIRANRICAAGCFLPLSTKDDIDKDLGTRHRAAIGVTEISDALVIVVSEETGTISMSCDGNLERNFNYNSLKQALNNYLAPQNADGGKHRHGKKNND